MTYAVGDRTFASFSEAVAAAKVAQTDVAQISNGLVRWTYVAPKTIKTVSHVLIMPNGERVPMGRVRQR